jgi:peptidoglycan hydrolase-like protein with peptidoglycan-binding domain
MILKQGCKGKQVEELQKSLNQILQGQTILKIDEDFGILTHNAVMNFQKSRFLNEIDGIVGPTTQNEIQQCLNDNWIIGQPFLYLGKSIYGGYHPSWGWMPDHEGKCSSFGGPNDLGDRMYGQAYIDDVKTPQEAALKFPTLMEMGIFRDEIKNIDKFTII